jgi:hypothetical protein
VKTTATPPHQQYASFGPSTLASLKKKKARTTYSGKWPTCYCYMLALETQQMQVTVINLIEARREENPVQLSINC